MSQSFCKRGEVKTYCGPFRRAGKLATRRLERHRGHSECYEALVDARRAK